MSQSKGVVGTQGQQPFVDIAYEVDVGDTVEKRKIPFVIGVLADLGPAEPPLPRLKDRRFIEIDCYNIDTVLRKASPHLRLNVQDKLSKSDASQMPVELRFRKMADFEPANIVSQLRPLRELSELREQLINLRGSLYGNEKLETLLQEFACSAELSEQIRLEIGTMLERDQGRQSPDAAPNLSAGLTAKDSLLAQIVTDSHMVATVEEREYAKQWIAAFFQQILTGKMLLGRDPDAAILMRVTDIDLALSLQLDEILHEPEFQRIEATWRGLHYLVTHTQTSFMLKVKVLNISKRDLLRDCQRVVEIEQSNVFKKINEEQYGTVGGTPYSALIGDYQFGRKAEDIVILECMSKVAASAHAPFIGAVSPEMFNFESFIELSNPRSLSKIFDADVYRRWKYFRESDESTYVGLVLPHILLRLPYGRDTAPVEGFEYEESVDGTDHDEYLWGNAAYAFAARLTSAFAKYGWCAEIRGVERGGLVRDLPVHVIRTDQGEIVRSPTEIPISDRRQDELQKLGFIPLCCAEGNDYAVFFNAYSCHKPRMYLNDDANANERLVTGLEYVFAASRVAHYVKCIARDKLHVFMTAESFQAYLDHWIEPYVLVGDAKDESNAQRPLRDANFKVSQVPGKPGAYSVQAFLTPQFQLGYMTVPMHSSIKVGRAEPKD